MIDFHNHILPSVDDGSKTTEISLSMLRTASNQGITDVVNTVHYQHPKVEGRNINYKIINEEIRKLQAILHKNNINIKLHIGAEVFYLPNLLKIRKNPLVTFGHGKYMLIEFHPNFIPHNELNDLFNLKMSGVTPIIAHPERYTVFQENINLVYDYLNAGCLMQVDAGSLLGTLGKNALIAARKIIENGWCSILGSDAHDDNRRNFCLKDGYKTAVGLIGDKAESLINENPRKVIEGKSIVSQFKEMNQASYSIFDKILKRL